MKQISDSPATTPSSPAPVVVTVLVLMVTYSLFQQWFSEPPESAVQHNRVRTFVRTNRIWSEADGIFSLLHPKLFRALRVHGNREQHALVARFAVGKGKHIRIGR